MGWATTIFSFTIIVTFEQSLVFVMTNRRSATTNIEETAGAMVAKVSNDPEALTDYATQVFGSRQLAMEWQESPVTALDRKQPKEFWGTAEGRKRVYLVLRKIEFGEFS